MDLLIIGNGFDLQCGLKSDYKSFIKWLREDTARSNDNLWAVHFTNRPTEDLLWIDVETVLQEAISGRDPVVRQWAVAAVYSHNKIEKRWFHKFRGEEFKYIENRIKDIDGDTYPFKTDWSPDKLTVDISTFDWFLDELKAFERQFSEYLKLEVTNSACYLENSVELTKMITGGEEVNIISFNYTNPFSRCRARINSVANVHGTYEANNIIFGVDATATLPPDAHIFTKTHRKMTQTTSFGILPLDSLH